MRRWWSGLSQETVNLPPSGFVGSNPTRRTILKPYFLRVVFASEERCSKFLEQYQNPV